jgi:hypothetical protein
VIQWILNDIGTLLGYNQHLQMLEDGSIQGLQGCFQKGGTVVLYIVVLFCEK